jgi:hypothetical protein
MIHFSTQNNSFLKMYKILQEFGVEDNTFFLRLDDETLLNIDPLDEKNLTQEQKIRIHYEIKNNPWYYFREIIRIPTSGEKRMFELTRGTLAILWSIINDLSSFVVLPRQCYKTYTVAIAYSWLFYWGTTDTEFTFFSYADSILQGNLQRVKEVRDTLPDYLNLFDERRDKDNAREMRLNNKDYYNWIRIKAPSRSKDTADKAGRGLSSAIVWYDEMCFIPNVQLQYEASTFSYKTVADIAKKNGSHHHRIMTSTTGHLDSPDGLWCFNFINSCCEFNEKMFDYETDTVKEMILKNSTNGFMYIEFMYYDLGKDDNYLTDMQKDAVSPDAFRREVLNSWEATSEEHPLGQEVIALLNNYIHKPSDILVIDNVYFLKLYKKIEELDFTKRYIAGIDCGGNLLKDFSTFVLVDPENFETVATLRTNSYSTTRFSRAIAYLMLKVFTNCVIVPERNNMGIAIIDNINDNFPQLKSRIYFDEKDKPGFVTTHHTRSLLLNNLLKVVVTEDYDKLHDISIINEIIGLKKTRSGRIDHDPVNGHDDTLFAYLFTRWFFSYALNKNKYIDPMMIGTQIPEDTLTINDGIEELTKGALMSNYKNLLLNESNSDSMIDANMEINPLYKNPRLADKEWERQRQVSHAGTVADTMDLITKRAQDRFKPSIQELERLEFEETEKILDPDVLYNKNPRDVSKQTQNIPKEKINIFQAQNLGKRAEEENLELAKKLDSQKGKLVRNMLFG